MSGLFTAAAILATMDLNNVSDEDTLQIESRGDDHIPEAYSYDKYVTKDEKIFGVHIPSSDWEHSDERVRKAEEKRIRKQQKRLKNKGA